MIVVVALCCCSCNTGPLNVDGDEFQYDKCTYVVFRTRAGKMGIVHKGNCTNHFHLCL